MPGPPSKKWKGVGEDEEKDDSFDEDDEVLDGPSERFLIISQRTQGSNQSSRPITDPSSSVSPITPPTVTSSSRFVTSPGETAYKTTPTSSRIRPSVFSGSRSSTTTPTSSNESQSSAISQGEFIAVKFQLGNAQREKDELKYKLAKANEDFVAEKKRMEMENAKLLRKMEEKIKVSELEVNALRMSNASMRAETSMAGGDLNQSMMSISSVGSSQRINPYSHREARATQSVPRLSGGNGFHGSDIAATFTHNQSMTMEGEMSFQDVPSQAFDSVMDTPILESITPIEKKRETWDKKLQADLANEHVLDISPFSQYILSTISSIAVSPQVDEELYSLLEKMIKNPLEQDIVEIGDSQFSPVSSQEDSSSIPPNSPPSSPSSAPICID